MAGNRICMEGRKKMSTTTRPVLSNKNPYWIEKHRYYELKHFCLQYPAWKKKLNLLDGYSHDRTIGKAAVSKSSSSNPTYETVETRAQYLNWCCLVEQAARETEPDLAPYILKAVTEGLSYEVLKLRVSIPCCRDTYYDLYRRFFWLLSKERQ